MSSLSARLADTKSRAGIAAAPSGSSKTLGASPGSLRGTLSHSERAGGRLAPPPVPLPPSAADFDDVFMQPRSAASGSGSLSGSTTAASHPVTTTASTPTKLQRTAPAPASTVGRSTGASKSPPRQTASPRETAFSRDSPYEVPEPLSPQEVQRVLRERRAAEAAARASRREEVAAFMTRQKEARRAAAAKAAAESAEQVTRKSEAVARLRQEERYVARSYGEAMAEVAAVLKETEVHEEETVAPAVVSRGRDVSRRDSSSLASLDGASTRSNAPSNTLPSQPQPEILITVRRRGGSDSASRSRSASVRHTQAGSAEAEEGGSYTILSRRWVPPPSGWQTPAAGVDLQATYAAQAIGEAPIVDSFATSLRRPVAPPKPTREGEEAAEVAQQPQQVQQPARHAQPLALPPAAPPAFISNGSSSRSGSAGASASSRAARAAAGVSSHPAASSHAAALTSAASCDDTLAHVDALYARTMALRKQLDLLGGPSGGSEDDDDDEEDDDATPVAPPAAAPPRRGSAFSDAVTPAPRLVIASDSATTSPVAGPPSTSRSLPPPPPAAAAVAPPSESEEDEDHEEEEEDDASFPGAAAVETSTLHSVTVAVSVPPMTAAPAAPSATAPLPPPAAPVPAPAEAAPTPVAAAAAAEPLEPGMLTPAERAALQARLAVYEANSATSLAALHSRLLFTAAPTPPVEVLPPSEPAAPAASATATASFTGLADTLPAETQPAPAALPLARELQSTLLQSLVTALRGGEAPSVQPVDAMAAASPSPYPATKKTVWKGAYTPPQTVLAAAPPPGSSPAAALQARLAKLGDTGKPGARNAFASLLTDRFSLTQTVAAVMVGGPAALGRGATGSYHGQPAPGSSPTKAPAATTTTSTGVKAPWTGAYTAAAPGPMAAAPPLPYPYAAGGTRSRADSSSVDTELAAASDRDSLPGAAQQYAGAAKPPRAPVAAARGAGAAAPPHPSYVDVATPPPHSPAGSSLDDSADSSFTSESSGSSGYSDSTGSQDDDGNTTASVVAGGSPGAAPSRPRLSADELYRRFTLSMQALETAEDAHATLTALQSAQVEAAAQRDTLAIASQWHTHAEAAATAAQIAGIAEEKERELEARTAAIRAEIERAHAEKAAREVDAARLLAQQLAAIQAGGKAPSTAFPGAASKALPSKPLPVALGGDDSTYSAYTDDFEDEASGFSTPPPVAKTAARTAAAGAAKAAALNPGDIADEVGTPSAYSASFNSSTSSIADEAVVPVARGGRGAAFSPSSSVTEDSAALASPAAGGGYGGSAASASAGGYSLAEDDFESDEGEGSGAAGHSTTDTASTATSPRAGSSSSSALLKAFTADLHGKLQAEYALLEAKAEALRQSTASELRVLGSKQKKLEAQLTSVNRAAEEGRGDAPALARTLRKQLAAVDDARRRLAIKEKAGRSDLARERAAVKSRYFKELLDFKTQVGRINRHALNVSGSSSGGVSPLNASMASGSDGMGGGADAFALGAATADAAATSGAAQNLAAATAAMTQMMGLMMTTMQAMLGAAAAGGGVAGISPPAGVPVMPFPMPFALPQVPAVAVAAPVTAALPAPVRAVPPPAAPAPAAATARPALDASASSTASSAYSESFEDEEAALAGADKQPEGEDDIEDEAGWVPLDEEEEETEAAVTAAAAAVTRPTVTVEAPAPQPATPAGKAPHHGVTFAVDAAPAAVTPSTPADGEDDEGSGLDLGALGEHKSVVDVSTLRTKGEAGEEGGSGAGGVMTTMLLSPLSAREGGFEGDTHIGGLTSPGAAGVNASHGGESSYGGYSSSFASEPSEASAYGAGLRGTTALNGTGDSAASSAAAATGADAESYEVDEEEDESPMASPRLAGASEDGLSSLRTHPASRQPAWVLSSDICPGPLPPASTLGAVVDLRVPAFVTSVSTQPVPLPPADLEVSLGLPPGSAPVPAFVVSASAVSGSIGSSSHAFDVSIPLVALHSLSPSSATAAQLSPRSVSPVTLPGAAPSSSSGAAAGAGASPATPTSSSGTAGSKLAAGVAGSGASPDAASPLTPGGRPASGSAHGPAYGRDDVFLSPSAHRSPPGALLGTPPSPAVGGAAAVLTPGSAHSVSSAGSVPASPLSASSSFDEEDADLYDFGGLSAAVAPPPKAVPKPVGASGPAGSEASSRAASPSGGVFKEGDMVARRRAAAAAAAAVSASTPVPPAAAWEKAAAGVLTQALALLGPWGLVEAALASIVPSSDGSSRFTRPGEDEGVEWGRPPLPASLLPQLRSEALSSLQLRVLFDALNEEAAKLVFKNVLALRKAAALRAAGPSSTAAAEAAAAEVAAAFSASLSATIIALARSISPAQPLGAIGSEAYAATVARADAVARQEVAREEAAFGGLGGWDDLRVDEESVLALINEDIEAHGSSMAAAVHRTLVTKFGVTEEVAASLVSGAAPPAGGGQ